MTNDEIEAFFEIVKTGSISGAAERLFVTQPALTRRIQTLEAELGYCLFKRSKGQKKIELTQEGNAFISVARRLQDLWQEARDIKEMDQSDLLKLSAISSVSNYILPEVFRSLSEKSPKIRIYFWHSHSFEAYDYVANGMVDLALIADARYYPNIETIPLYQEPMILLSNTSKTYPETVSPDLLNPRDEIFLSWNPEYNTWHDYWFGASMQYHAYMDQMSLLEYFISREDTWAIAPFSVAAPVSRLPYVASYRLESPPPARIIYYIKKINREIRFEETFLKTLKQEISRTPEYTLL